MKKQLIYITQKKSNGKSWKMGFSALSKLVYSKIQLLELVESSMEMSVSDLGLFREVISGRLVYDGLENVNVDMRL